jgi:hypothetical protein
MKFNLASTVDQLVWQMRLADLPRGENRAILNRLYNGDPPFDEKEAEENQVQVNRNDLAGVNLLSQARRQWDQAFMKPGDLFSVSLDSGAKRKRKEWSHIITKHANRVLKKSRRYMEQSRATGANTILHGIGPVVWGDRRTVVPKAIDVPSLMIPSDTEIDFDNLPYIAFFQELTPAQLYTRAFGSRRDPGWNEPMVKAQLQYVANQVQKQPNATAFQYMPERIEELIKQDMGMWSSDCVPTIDYWDFYFREEMDGPVFRRIILDWGLSEGEARSYGNSKAPPPRKSLESLSDKEKAGFLYTSGKRKFADDFSEIVHCQFGDCSAVAPFRYHSVRSLGWMLWGVCDLETRLHCKFTEALFEQLMWFFEVASNDSLTRLRRADFFNFGVIPPGVRFLKANDRFTPNMQMVEAGFARYKQIMADNAASFTQEFDKGNSGKEMTATETMARVNAVNALVSGMLNLAYTYEEYKDFECLRRLCIPHNPDRLARSFYKGCLADGVPSEILDANRMTVTRERVLGAGNKTLEMAQVQFLQSLRKNLNPDGQRMVDHIAIESATSDADLAENLAPVEAEKRVSHSTQEAQLATDRLMRGLPFQLPPEAVPEDYVIAWLMDLGMMVKRNVDAGGMATPQDIGGYQALAAAIEGTLKIMSGNDEERAKVTQYQSQLAQIMNHVKAFEARLAAAAKARNGAGGNGTDPKDAAKAQAMVIQAQTKAKLNEQSHAQKTAQRQIAFDLEQQRKEREHAAEMRRLTAEHGYEMLTGHVERLTDAAPKAARRPEPAEIET